MEEQNREILKQTQIQNVYLSLPFPGKLQLEKRNGNDEEIACLYAGGKEQQGARLLPFPRALPHYSMCTCEMGCLNKNIKAWL